MLLLNELKYSFFSKVVQFYGLGFFTVRSDVTNFITSGNKQNNIWVKATINDFISFMKVNFSYIIFMTNICLKETVGLVH